MCTWYRYIALLCSFITDIIYPVDKLPDCIPLQVLPPPPHACFYNLFVPINSHMFGHSTILTSLYIQGHISISSFWRPCITRLQVAGYTYITCCQIHTVPCQCALEDLALSYYGIIASWINQPLFSFGTWGWVGGCGNIGQSPTRKPTHLNTSSEIKRIKGHVCLSERRPCHMGLGRGKKLCICGWNLKYYRPQRSSEK